jgi:uncharacterized protein
MKTAVIIHGSLGNPEKHWYPWLGEQLVQKGFEVFRPQFPIEEGKQTVANWLKVLEPIKGKLEGGIIVGHSLGAPFIVDILNEWDVRITGAFFVGGFIGPHEAEGVTFEDFSERDYDWEKIKNSCQSFVVLNSDDDPYVPLAKGKLLAEKLGVELTVVPGAGHFQSQSGYETFPLLLQKIEEVT